MKKIKMLTSLMLTIMMVLSLCVGAFGAAAAGENNCSITITPPSGTDTYTYEVYQVFKGKLEDGILSDIEWGDGVNSGNLLTALTTNMSTEFPAATCKTAADVAKALEAIKDNSTKVEDFAKYVSQNLSTTKNTANAGNQYTVGDLAPGYYFVKDPATTHADGAWTDFILKVLGTETVKAKTDVPSVNKKVYNNTTSSWTDANNANVDEVVKYQITSNVPDFKDFNKYWMKFTDTLDKGLTLDKTSFTIKVQKGTEAATTLYSSTVPNTNIAISYDDAYDANSLPTKDTTITITLKDMETWAKAYVGYTITIEYEAKLNQNALRSYGVKSATSNDNDIVLNFPNDPNKTYGGEPPTGDEPDPNQPVGETPHKTVHTYTTGIKIKKVDESGNALAGAEFTITGTGTKKVLVDEVKYTEDNTGTYYPLKNGTYTTTAPVEATADQYEGGLSAKTYKKEFVKTVKEIPTTVDGAWTAKVDDEGYLYFEDLGEGTWTITETKAPKGYNKIDAITVTISATYEADGKINWTVTANPGGTITEVDEANACYILKVENHKGSTLPETGGIGTTLFYVIGGLLVVGASVTLITKKRMQVNK